MIKEIDNFMEVLQIVPHEVESREKYPDRNSIPIRDYIMVLDCLMNRKPFIVKKEFKIWFSYSDDGELNGYLIGLLTLTTIKSLNEVRLVKAWYSKDYPNVMNELVDEAIRWAKEHKIKLLKAEADWHDKLIETLEKKWAFQKCTAMMSRRI